MNINRLKDLREDDDLTQKKIYNMLQTTQKQYSKYEILTNFYNTSIDYLIGRTNHKEPYKDKITS